MKFTEECLHIKWLRCWDRHRFVVIQLKYFLESSQQYFMVIAFSRAGTLPLDNYLTLGSDLVSTVLLIANPFVVLSGGPIGKRFVFSGTSRGFDRISCFGL